jgi:hypothetical protein
MPLTKDVADAGRVLVRLLEGGMVLDFGRIADDQIREVVLL